MRILFLILFVAFSALADAPKPQSSPQPGAQGVCKFLKHAKLTPAQIKVLSDQWNCK